MKNKRIVRFSFVLGVPLLPFEGTHRKVLASEVRSRVAVEKPVNVLVPIKWPEAGSHGFELSIISIITHSYTEYLSATGMNERTKHVIYYGLQCNICSLLAMCNAGQQRCVRATSARL